MPRDDAITLNCRAKIGKSRTKTAAWIPIIRECNVGDSGSLNMCNSPSCRFCDIVRNGFTKHGNPKGLTIFSTSERLTVDHGRLSGVVAHQLKGGTAAQEHDVVKISTYQRGRKVDTGDLYVYNAEAILPLGAIIYTL
ncbi:hypothetical protein DFP72DRAFT_862716 [Ephemerocybe angulata]|uniref:Uncharacterized protein n=1 Tax=Ephemerocybe angulata TaxID=980116 RepID=A0A8H6LU84_9AGAR|nr:hypothetical protein DFP72DRAFT_862716 [Tulosesus angulatus]